MRMARLVILVRRKGPLRPAECMRPTLHMTCQLRALLMQDRPLQEVRINRITIHANPIADLS